MIERGTSCYLFKSTKDGQNKIYHRTYPDMTSSDHSRWNTFDKKVAGCFTKAQWQERSTKWAANSGWMLESITGEVEAL